LAAFGTTVGTFCQGNDSRLSDDRTASGLRSASTIVSVSAATAPSAGQVLTATANNAATWQGITPTVTATDTTGTITTASTSDVLATGLTVTPAAGTYEVWFCGDVSNNTSTTNVFTSVYSGGSQVAASQRQYSRATTAVTSAFTCIAKVTVNGSQAIEGRWRVSAGTGTMLARQLHIMKVV
jgi:hypothetical protein